MFKKQKLNFEPRWFAIIVFFVAGVFMGAFVLFVWVFNGGRLYGIQKIHPPKGNYKYINPLIAVDREQTTDFFANKSLQNQLTAIVDTYKKNQNIQDASVYFRDLDPGRWVGINEDAKFSPGKLLKVPIMIAYFKISETNPAILTKPLIFKTSPQDTANSNNIVLEDGKAYPTEELIKDMIIDDSDSSANILYDNIDKQALDEVFSDLGINFKEEKQSDDFLTIKLYSLIFRVLYNSTYLSRDLSEKALDILSHTPNTDGVSSGLPNDLVVANKYRTRDYGRGNLKESHDCGIIYYPDHPYLLCVMAISKDESVINSLFKEVSLTAYKDMQSTYKN